MANESELFCRLCAIKSESYINVFGEDGVRLHLIEKIRQCLQITISETDSLPITICIGCCVKVEDFFKYFHLCSESQHSLREIFKAPGSVVSLHHQVVDDKQLEKPICTQQVIRIEGGFPVEEVEEKFACIENEASPERIESSIPEASAPENVRSKRNSASSLFGFKDESSDQEGGDDSSFDFPSEGTSTNTSWACTLCDHSPQSLPALKAHYLESHKQDPVFKCTQCTKVYSRYRSFARHLKLHGNPKRYICEICGKSFSQKTVLQSHSTVHSEERPHVCIQCGKAFKQFSSLYLHSKCHLPDQEKPKFPCSLCSKEFSTKHTLDMHMKIHTGERNFICDICGKSFIAKGSLDYHMLTHNDDKPHACSVCGKGFKTARLLTKHSTLHTGVKPHQCDVCGKQFRERGALKEHNRIHTGAMPYSCEFCGRNFRFKGILTVHRRQHTGERPYSCTDCSREFTNWANYNKHMKRRHKSSQDQGTAQPPQQPLVGTYEPVIEIENPAPYPESVGVYRIQDQEVYRGFPYTPVNPQIHYYIPSPVQDSGFERNQ